jgi:hypothetical protein
MITYLTFQKLSTNIWEMINPLSHLRNVSPLGRRSTQTATHVRTSTPTSIIYPKRRVLKIKRRKNTTETINIGIETQAKARIAVNREIAVRAATKVITSNEIMETLTVIKVLEATVVSQEADPAMTTAMGKEIKTETETETAMHTDKMNTDKTIKTKATATFNAVTTHVIKSDAGKMSHTRSKLTTKTMMNKTLTFRTTAMTTPPTMYFTLPMKNFTR